MKHFGSFLFDAGRQVKHRSEHILSLFHQRFELQIKLDYINSRIEEEEKEFEVYIKDDWNNQEIRSAKLQAEENNKK